MGRNGLLCPCREFEKAEEDNEDNVFHLSFSLLIHQLRRKDSKNATSKESFFAKKIVFFEWMRIYDEHTDTYRCFQENSHEYIYAHMYAGVFFQNIAVSSVSVFLSSPSWP